MCVCVCLCAWPPAIALQVAEGAVDEAGSELSGGDEEGVNRHQLPPEVGRRGLGDVHRNCHRGDTCAAGGRERERRRLAGGAAQEMALKPTADVARSQRKLQVFKRASWQYLAHSIWSTMDVFFFKAKLWPKPYTNINWPKPELKYNKLPKFVPKISSLNFTKCPSQQFNIYWYSYTISSVKLQGTSAR